MRGVAGLAVLLAVLSGAAAPGRGEDPRAAIVIPPAATTHRRDCARLLQSIVEQATGVRMPIVDHPGDGLSFHVGASTYVDSLGLNLASLDDDGFVLKLVDSRDYVIAGPTDWGTEFGVCEFLERAAGVRWLFPGPLGTDVPRRQQLELPREEIRARPAFWSRWLSGMQGPVEAEWARRQRVHTRVAMHHNLKNLLPPSRFAATHPDFYPLVNGQRYVPRNDDDYNWQPNFEAEGIAAAAADRIKRYFQEHPEETTYSLGVNDSARFDDSSYTQTDSSPRLNYLRLRDASDAYYRWCNTVVEAVARVYPDRTYGCLAYNNVAEPPDFKLQPSIMPFLPDDRLSWADPALATVGQGLTQRWKQSATLFAWGDYVYGSPYCLPRVYPHRMAENLRWGRDHGVGAVYAEAYPYWAEGPKLYVYLRLLWNPDLDVDAVLDDWYEHCVGSDAAPSLKEYYAIWERFWTSVAPRSAWWPHQAVHYLPFDRPEYLAAVDESDLRHSRELLQRCVERAATPAQRERADLLRQGFEYYEASALAYRGDVIAAQRVLASEEAALAAVDDAARRLALADRRLGLLARPRQDTLLASHVDVKRFPALIGDDWSIALLWSLFDWGERSPAVRDRLAGLAKDSSERVRTQAAAIVHLLRERGAPVSTNDSFESSALKPWFTDVKKDVGSLQRVAGHARTGQYAMLCQGTHDGRLHQFLPITPGTYGVLGYVYRSTAAGEAPTIKLSVCLCDDAAVLRGFTPTVLRPVAQRWTAIAFRAVVPATCNEKKVTRLLLTLAVEGGEEAEVYIDDVALYRLPD